MALPNKRLRVKAERDEGSVGNIDQEEQINLQIKQEQADSDSDTETIPMRRTSCNSDHQPDLIQFPNNVVKLILKSIPSYQQQQTLLNCRLVCTQWNQVMQDTPELMTKITFPIWHPKPFLDLPIVKRLQVKSISFRTVFQNNYLQSLVSLFNTVDKVKFTFDDVSTIKKQKEFVACVLKVCNNLRQLIIGDFVGPPQKFLSQPFEQIGFMGLTSFIDLAAANTITILSVNMNSFVNLDLNGLVQLILLLPKLQKIELFRNLPNNTIPYGLCKYLAKYKSDLHLKEVALSLEDRELPNQYIFNFTPLLKSCTRLGVNIIQLPTINLNGFLNLAIPEKILAPNGRPRRPLFVAKVNGKLTFMDTVLTNLHRLNALNFGKLELIFKRSILKGEVNWFRSIKNLEQLVLTNGEQGTNTASMSKHSVAELELILCDGFPSVKTLKVEHGLLDPMRAFRWSLYFPNLTELVISLYKTTPPSLISQLTSLEQLTTLHLSDLPFLDDNSFTVQFVNKFATNNGAPELAPAIACFKSLKTLRLVDCNKLTKMCVINGIAKCKTLEKLKVGACGKIEQVRAPLVNCKAVMTNNL